MKPEKKSAHADQHDAVKETYDEVQTDGRYEEGMARMAFLPPSLPRPGDVSSGDVYKNLC